MGRLGGDADVVEALVSAAAAQGMQMEVQAEVSFPSVGLRAQGSGFRGFRVWGLGLRGCSLSH